MKKPGKVLIWLAIVPILCTAAFFWLLREPHRQPHPDTTATAVFPDLAGVTLCLNDEGAVTDVLCRPLFPLGRRWRKALPGLSFEKAVLSAVESAQKWNFLTGQTVNIEVAVTEPGRDAWEKNRLARAINGMSLTFRNETFLPEDSVVLVVQDISEARMENSKLEAGFLPSGQIHREVWHRNGVTRNYYYENGVLRRVSEFANGRRTWQRNYDENGFPIFDQ